MYELPKVFVRPGEGRKVPLPVKVNGAGTAAVLVPSLGKEVLRTAHVERLISSGDLVVRDAPKPEAPPAPAAAVKEKG